MKVISVSKYTVFVTLLFKKQWMCKQAMTSISCNKPIIIEWTNARSYFLKWKSDPGRISFRSCKNLLLQGLTSALIPVVLRITVLFDSELCYKCYKCVKCALIARMDRYNVGERLWTIHHQIQIVNSSKDRGTVSVVFWYSLLQLKPV